MSTRPLAVRTPIAALWLDEGTADMSTRTRHELVAPGIHRLSTGRGLGESNAYLVESGSGWTLVDTAWPHRAGLIRAGAESLFGPGARPAAILLTHIHLDHAGSALELARMWTVPVWVHPDELPMAADRLPDEPVVPLDRVILPVLRRWPRHRTVDRQTLADVVRPFDADGSVPGLPDWRCIPTPGHSPGHVAFFRPADRVLITGDAVLTVDLNSLTGLLLGRHRLAGPRRFTTWNWPAAKGSVARLAALQPDVLASGHGRPMTGAGPALQSLDQELNGGIPVAHGLIRPVHYSAPGAYRRPPAAYRRLQGLGPVLTRLGISPSYVVTLEVPGRRSGIIRRTNLVRATHCGQHYLVALAGESEWVRNVRAAGGRVVIGRRVRHAATLIEVPEGDRPDIIRAYLLRAGRAGTRAEAGEAGSYFGVRPDPTDEELRAVAGRYPVFRIVEDGSPGSAPSASTTATEPATEPALVPAGRSGTNTVPEGSS